MQKEQFRFAPMLPRGKFSWIEDRGAREFGLQENRDANLASEHMNPYDEKLEIAFIAAFMTFFFGLVSLGIREVLERLREQHQRRDELRLLMYLYAAEVTAVVEKCAQYVRQISLVQVSRSELPLLVGASKLDRVTALEADPNVIKALHDAYRLFGLVQNQIDKRDPAEFQAIYAFVITEMNSFPEATRRIFHYARELHGKHETRLGRRLLARVAEALSREFLVGLPEKPTLGLARFDLKRLEAKVDESMREITEWVVSRSMAIGLFQLPKEDLPSQIAIAKMHPLKTRCKILRVLMRYIELAVQNSRNTTESAAQQEPAILAGYQIIDLPPPTGWLDRISIPGVFKPWNDFVLKNDHQPWDV